MKLGQLLNVSNLLELMQQRYITMQRHPTLPMAILNYTNNAMFDGFWPPEVQHCRGLIINPVKDHNPCDDCEIISRPFHKFFNLNQTEETRESYLHTLGIEPTITEKMDGWFGIQWKCPDANGVMQHGVASRGSFTSPGAVYATQKLQKLVKYGAVEEFPAGYSPIYEIICPDCKIVVDYPFEGLVLLGCVNNETGEDLDYEALQAVWAKIAGYSADNRPWIRLVKAHRMSIGDCLISDKKNFEGFVASYARPGLWPAKVKIKLEDYRRLHRLITGVTPQQIWTSLYDPMAPWLGNGVPDHFRKWATGWRDAMYDAFDEKYRKALAIVNDSVFDLANADLTDKQDRKKVSELVKSLAGDLDSTVMYLLEKKAYDAHQSIWRQIRPIGRESETFYREGQGE